MTFLSTTQTPKPPAWSFQGADYKKRMIVLYFLLCVCDAELLNVHLLELRLNPNSTLQPSGISLSQLSVRLSGS